MTNKLFLLLLLGYAAARIHKISPSRQRFLGRKGLLPFKLENRNEYQPSQPRLPLASGKPVIQNRISFDGYALFVNVTIGTPQQTFPVYLDTGSSDLTVSDSYCRNDFFSTCSSPEFNTQNSSTYVQIKEEKYLIIGQDTVHLGGISEQQLAIPKTRFIDFTSGDNSDGAVYGTLGLAFQSLSATGGEPPLPNAIEQNLLAPFFTVYLKTMTKLAMPSDNAGTITYGGLDTENCGSVIAYQPLSSTTYYQFTLSEFSFGSYSTNKAAQAISDTATPYILVPTAVYNAAIQQLNGSFNESDSTIPCDIQLPPINIKIGANTYTIDGKHQVWDYNFGNNRCEWALYSAEDLGFSPPYVLGGAFIQQYCNIYDMGNKRIGFAPVTNP